MRATINVCFLTIVIAAFWLGCATAEAKDFVRITPEQSADAHPSGHVFSQTWSGGSIKGKPSTWDSNGQRVSGIPVGSWYFVVRDLGTWDAGTGQSKNREIEEAVAYEGSTGDWGKYTGLFLGANPGAYQRGRYDDYNGTVSMFQMKGVSVGSFINTETFTHCDEVDRSCHPGGGVQSYYGIILTDRKIFPWKGAGANSNEGLVLQGYFKVPFVNKSPKSVVEISFSVYLHDTSSTHPKVVSFLVNLFRSTPMARGYYDDDGCAKDAVKTQDLNNDGVAEQYFVTSQIAKGTCYTTELMTAASTASSTWQDEQFVRVHITAENLLRAIRRMNSKGKLPSIRPFGEDLSKYQLTSFGVLQELFPINGDISNGYSVRALGAYQYFVDATR